MSFINVLKEKLEAQQIYAGLKGKYETRFNIKGVPYALLATSVGGDVGDNTQWYLEFENINSHRIGVGDNDKEVAKAMGEAVKQWVETTQPHCFFTYGSSIESIQNIIESIKKAVKKYNVDDPTLDLKDESGGFLAGNPIGKIIWSKMVTEDDTTAEEKSNIKSIEFEKTFEEPKDLKTAKEFTNGTSKSDKLDKGDKAYDMKLDWQEYKKASLLKEEIESDSGSSDEVAFFIQKFKDKMKGSTYQTAMGWVNGIKELSKEDKEKVKKGIMNMVTHKPNE
jgi:hypothetical protein